MNKQFNPLNSEVLTPDEQNKLNTDQQALWAKHNQLIHQVFAQNPKGKELLSLWKETLIMVPTVTASSTKFDAGISEGKKAVVREIILAINSVEGK